MPQIWLTHDELAALMDCDATAARTVAAAVPLDRRRSRDGRTRVKLNGALTEIFLNRMSRGRLDRDLPARGTTAYAAQLWTLLELMAEPSTNALPAPSSQPDQTCIPSRPSFPNR